MWGASFVFVIVKIFRAPPRPNFWVPQSFLHRYAPDGWGKRPENSLNLRFWGVYNLIYSSIFFVLEDESANGLLTFCKSFISGKNHFLEKCPKMYLEQSKCMILRTSRALKLNLFCDFTGCDQIWLCVPVYSQNDTKCWDRLILRMSQALQ